MHKRAEMHKKLICDGLNEISNLPLETRNAFSMVFGDWKKRVARSLTELFGKGHYHTARFSALKFWRTRSSIVEHRLTHEDQKRFEDDLLKAKQILSTATEEFKSAPPDLPPKS
jgi:hypothetical protein